MDKGLKINRKNPLNTSNIFSKLFFCWMIGLCYKGTKKKLDVSDLFQVRKKDESKMLADKLEGNWLSQKWKNPKKPQSLLRAIVKTFIWKYMIFGGLLFVQMIFVKSFQPIVLSYFIGLFSKPDNTIFIDEMYISGSIILLQSILAMFFTHHIELGQSAIGMRIRIAVSSLVYRKMLRLNAKSLGQTAAGQLVNLLSNDVQRFELVTVALHYIWIMPFQVILITYLMWQQVGIAALAGVLSMVLLTLPAQSYMGKLFSHFRLQIAQKCDRRVQLMSEIISSIQVIKMYAWEKPFELIVKMARKNEIKPLSKASYLRGFFMSAMVFIERTTLYLTVICYMLLGHEITADKVFSMAQFYNMLQLAMAILYPMAITFAAEASVSIKRLEDFLMMEERPDTGTKQGPTEENAKKEVIFKNLSASWTNSSDTLKNINLHIPSGCLCAIVGPVGAGKSSLLSLILGELTSREGSLKISGKISYSSQEPWLFAASVRDNILFGEDYNKLLYRQIVKVCALEKDFQQFPQRDQTIVGERGVSLSGGQRARINLARAVYRQSDIYLFDDPLSAVDTHVGKHLFQECLHKYLKNKTRILVTHQLQHLKKADLIVVLDEGKILAQGTFEELIQADLDFTKLLAASDETGENEQPKNQGDYPGLKMERKASILSSGSVMSESSMVFETEENSEELSSPDATPFKDYIKASGNFFTISGLLLCFLLGQAFCNGTDFWLAFVTEQESIRSSNSTILGNISTTARHFYDAFFEQVEIQGKVYDLLKSDVAMYIYTGLILSAILVTIMRSMLYYKMAMTASKNLHNSMFSSLLRAPLRFFDTNPSGRVLNRFSKDMGAVDEILPRFLLDALQIFLVMAGILIIVTVSNYFIIVAIIIFGGILYKMCGWYVCTAKDIKHLEGITKSPVFSHLNSSLNGITTIRASGAEEVLIGQFDQHQDAHTAAYYLTISTRTSFGLWMDCFCLMFVSTIIYIFIILNQYMHFNGSAVGLAVSQALILMGMLQFGMIQAAQVINQLTSVERIMQYTKLENEEVSDKDSEASPKNWPSSGHLAFLDLSLRYSLQDPPVLKDLSFEIKPGKKIGIVGRTGAGKSSIISALFRLSLLEGQIVIDGVDTQKIKLADLRRKISIIPQEPVLFSATLRYNLDPFQEFQDQELWTALQEVELKDSVPSLDFQVSEGGANFSLGQRQLVCLARAILRNNKILVLDEATANVDPQTDALIQSTIRRKFDNCTVLTIAHRLNTIMDSDKILVMDSGRVVEFDHPYILLQDSDGFFSKMVAETGPTMTQQLTLISKNVYLGSIKE